MIEIFTLADLGIKTYEDYKRNSQDIFYILDKMVDEYINKHSEVIEQAVDKFLENYVSIEDFVVRDTNIFEVND